MLTAEERRKSSYWQRYDDLAREMDGAMDTPHRRLSLAQDLAALSWECDEDAQLRLSALKGAVRLDPFKASHRLALGQVELGLGLAREAVADFRAALTLWPDSPAANLLLGEGLVACGESKEARDCFKKALGAADGNGLATRADLGLIECDLREARDSAAWQSVAKKLAGVDLGSRTETLAYPPGLVGEPVVVDPRASSDHTSPLPGCLYNATSAYCEKCLKVVLECDDPQIVESVLKTAEERIPSENQNHPAFALLRKAAEDPKTFLDGKHQPTPAGGDLLGLVMAYRLTRALKVGDAKDDSRVPNLMKLRKLAENSDKWPALKEAYVHQVGEWAREAYKTKQLPLAATLWSEAERLDDHDPRLLANLALVHTRMNDDRSQAWYWDKATEALTLHGEMMPEAESYAASLSQKHGAFAAAAHEKAALVTTNAERLELGAIWIKEAVPFLAYRQLGFDNPMFRCGVMSDDAVEALDRAALVVEGVASLESWLALAAEWQGLGEKSELVQWRKARMREAAALATESGPAAFRSYDDEKEAFKKYRETILAQFLGLLFRVLLPAAEELDINDKVAADRYAQVARGLMAFPHRQLKPGVLKVVEQLDQDTDLRELVVNYAIGPWFKKARELLEREQWQAALGYLDSANSAAPGVVVVLFHKALCHFQLEQWDAAESTAKEARGRCGPDDEQALEQLETMLDQLPLARTAKQMEKVQKAMERDDWPEAARLLDGILKTAPKSIPALFYRAVCHMHMDEWDQAESVARSTLKLCKASDSAAKEQLNLMLEQLPMAKESAALKPVTKALERDDWASAIREVEKYLSSNPKSAIGHFYKGLAQFRSKLPRDAHASAKAGLACATKTTPKEIRSQLEQLLEASDLPPWIEKMNQAVEEMNRDNWTKAIGRLDEVLAMDYSNAQAYFYRGLARFRATMEEIKSAGGVGPYMASYYSDKFETAQEDVNKAIRHAPVSEKELKKAAATLQKNITQALAQLNRF